MTDSLEAPRLIDRARLEPGRYLQTLVQQAAAAGLLGSGELAALQGGLAELLAQQAGLLLQGRSSSLPVERAQSLMASIIFVLGVQLKAYPTPEIAAAALKSEPLPALFGSGLRRVQRKTAAARLVHKRLCGRLFSTPNVYYRATICEGISGFFRLYRPQLFAQELHITADYPLCAGRPPLEGIEFIARYLDCAQAENDFLLLFAPQSVDRLLCGLGQDYREIPMNLFEPVLLSALGLALLQRAPLPLDLGAGDITALYRIFGGKSARQASQILRQALRQLGSAVPLPHSAAAYAAACLPALAAQVSAAAAHGCLNTVFLIAKSPAPPPAAAPCGVRMAGSSYRSLLSAVLQAEGEGKAALVSQYVHSLADLLDIISDAGLSQAELAMIARRLPPAALAALRARYCGGDASLLSPAEQLLSMALQGGAS